MVQRSVKRSAVRVRWEFSDTPYAEIDLNKLQHIFYAVTGTPLRPIRQR